MTEIAKLNFRIARLRHQMKGMQADIRLLSNAGLDCNKACQRLQRSWAEMRDLIARRDRVG